MSSSAPAPAALLLLALIAPGPGAAVPVHAADPAKPERATDPALLLDTAMPGDALPLTDLGEGPYVVVPIFTRCRAVCSTVAKTLKSAWGKDGPGGDAAPVVMVSFDPEDSQSDMARFRELFDLPPSWHLATVEREEGLRFFSSLGFQWRTLARRQFDHSGKIFVLTDDLRIASVLGPDQLTSERLEAELAAATSGASLTRLVGTHWIGFFGVGAILLTLAVAVIWERLRYRRQLAASS
jgi:cytochrome oxidase Cu insertion factor (SCO1/SenC/PrrC family)